MPIMPALPVDQGWEPLCAFLGEPVPDAAFAHVNSREEFKERVRGMKSS